MNKNIYKNTNNKQKKGGENFDTTERSSTVLQWLCEQEAVRLDQLQILLHWYDTNTTGAMAEHIQRTRKHANRVAFDTAFTLVRKWKREGSVLFERSVTGQPHWIWAIKKGIDRYSETKYVYRRKPREPRPHYYWCNHIRMYIELVDKLKGRQSIWIPDRHLRYEDASFKETFKYGDRFPDGKLIRDDGNIAQQIELHPKTAKRYHDILWRLAANYDTIWYWCNNRSLKTVQRNIGKLPKKLQHQFVIYHLSQTLKTIPVTAKLEATKL